MRATGKVFLKYLEMGAPEACLYIHGKSQYRFSRDIASFLQTAPSHERTNVLKNKHELQAMPDNYTDITKKNVISRYDARDIDVFGHICLATYHCGNNQKWHMLDRPRILRCHEYSFTRDPQNFYIAQVFLFLPWHTHGDSPLQNGHFTWQQVYTANKATIISNKAPY